MMEQAPVAIGLTRGRSHFIESMNASMLRIIGKNREEALGKNLTEVMPDIKDDFVLKILKTVLETGEAYCGNEVPFTYKLEEKLELHYLNVSYTPLIEEGDVTGLIHVAVDVTEQVVTRKKKEEDQGRFSNLVKQAPVAITFTRGREVVIETINASMLHIMGKESEEEVLGKAMVEVLPEIEGQHILKMAGQVFDSGEAFRGPEVPVTLQRNGELE